MSSILMNQYDVVEIQEIIQASEFKADSFNQRPPQVGDKATIIEIYQAPTLAYELECSDSNGITLWLQIVTTNEMVLKVV